MAGSMSIQMLGDVAMSDTIPITNSGFTRGDVAMVTTTAPIVGNIMMLKVAIKGPTEENPFVCTKIEIYLAYKMFEFPCSQPLFVEDGKKAVTLSVSGRTAYSLQIETCGMTSDPVFVEFTGTEGASTFVSLSDTGFAQGTFNVTAYADYVGDVFRVRMFKMVGSSLCIKSLSVG